MNRMAIAMEFEQYIHSIIEKLKEIDIYKVLLFGSCASGNVQEDSDIDLLIVLDEDVMPTSYDEWLEIKMKARRLLRDINNKIGLDLLVYTKPQYEMIQKEMNSFRKEIHETGKIIYEKAS
jgi:predicted nucleotidyltransferase